MEKAEKERDRIWDNASANSWYGQDREAWKPTFFLLDH